MSAVSGRIIAATDFSDDARHAVQRAAMLASTLRVELELLHVVGRSSLVAVREWTTRGFMIRSD